MQSDNDLLNEAIAEARTLRNLSMSNARQSLVNFLKEEKLPLDNLADAELDLDTFVDLIIKKSRERDEEEDKLNPQGLPYLNNKYIFSKQNNDDEELEERSRYSNDDIEFELDFGDGNIVKYNKDEDEIEDEENFSEAVLAEKSRKWDLLRNFRTSPAVRPTKLTKQERDLLISHAGLKESKYHSHLQEIKDDKDLLQERAKINKSDKQLAKQIVRDIAIKKKLLK